MGDMCKEPGKAKAYRVYENGEYQQTIWISPEQAERMREFGYELTE